MKTDYVLSSDSNAGNEPCRVWRSFPAEIHPQPKRGTAMKHGLLTVAIVFFLAACELVDEPPVSHESPTVTDQSDASQSTSELASKKGGQGGVEFTIDLVAEGEFPGDSDWQNRGPGQALVSNLLCRGVSQLNTKEVKAKEYNGGWNWDQIPCRFLEGNSPFDYQTNLFDEPPSEIVGQVLVYAHGITHNTIDDTKHMKFWLWGKECVVNTSTSHCDPIGDHRDQKVWVTDDLMFKSFVGMAPSGCTAVGDCTMFRVHIDQTVELCGGRKKNRSCIGPVLIQDLIFTRVGI